MVCGFFIERLCSGLWSSSFSIFSPSHPLFFFLPLFHQTGAWNGGSWLGCGDLPSMGAVFYLGAGWPQWKPMGIPGPHLPLKRGNWSKRNEYFVWISLTLSALWEDTNVLLWVLEFSVLHVFARAREKPFSIGNIHIFSHHFKLDEKYQVYQQRMPLVSKDPIGYRM